MTIWFWGGGGGLANLVGIDYLFSTWAWPENLFSGITKARIFIIISNKILEKQKKKQKKKKQKNKTKGGGMECWFRREAGQDFPGDFFLFLQTTGMCIQCMWMERLHAWFSFDYVYKEYIIESKTIVIEGGGGLGVSPENV